MRLQVPFKGPRIYLHSTQIWDALGWQAREGGFSLDAKFAQPDARLDLIIRGIIKTAIDAEIVGPKPLRGPDIAAEFCFIAADGEKLWGVLRETGDAVTERFDDVEDTLLDKVEHGEGSARYEGDMPMSLSQMHVALTKFMHWKIISRKIKWLATRLTLPLEHLDAAPRAVSVALRTGGPGSKATLTNVTAVGLKEPEGRINFVGVDGI